MGHVEAVEERKILVAVDESEVSLHALSWCLNNMSTMRRSSCSSCNPYSQIALTLLHVKRPTVVFPAKFQSDAEDKYSHDVLFSQDWRDEKMASWVIDKALKICEGYDVKVDAKVEEGDPTTVICRMADSLDADLLVVGSHGYGPTARALMGSVSGDCVQKARCPVVAVKKPKA